MFSCTPKGDKVKDKDKGGQADANEKESTLIRSRPSSADSQGSCSSPPPPSSLATPRDPADEPSTVRDAPDSTYSERSVSRDRTLLSAVSFSAVALPSREQTKAGLLKRQRGDPERKPMAKPAVRFR